MGAYNTKAVEDYWSNFDCAESDKNFYAFPPIRSRSSKLIFNEFDASRKDWCEYWTVEKYLKDKIPFKKCLSICCGFGEIERNLVRLNLAEKMYGTDIAPGAIETAQKRAKEEGFTNIEYFVADINTMDFAAEEYDIIWANGALHHIKELDTVIPKLFHTLKKGGYLIANEYVGPNYQQLSLRQQEIINAVKHLLPEELARKTKFPQKSKRPVLSKALRKVDGKLFPEQPTKHTTFDKIWEMKPVEHFLNYDPSEGVNSINIIPVLRKSFTDMEVKYFGGSILMYALDSKFYNNFDHKNTLHQKLLELVFQIEDNLIASGEIGSDNAHIICRK